MKKTYKDLGMEVGELVDKKQKAYGNSFGKGGDILKILYPNGVKLEEYTDMLCIIRIIDKLFRIATEKRAFDESVYCDLCGYSLLGMMKDIEEEEMWKETCNRM